MKPRRNPAAIERSTPVHSRYQVCGVFGDGAGEVYRVAQSRDEALTLARKCIGPNRYDSAVVFDAMAKRGDVQEWIVCSHGAVKAGRRRPMAGELR